MNLDVPWLGWAHAMTRGVLSVLLGTTRLTVMATLAILITYFNVSYRSGRVLMHLGLFVTIAVGVFGATMQVRAGEPGAGQLTFQSASYADFRQLLSGAAPATTVTVSAILSFPDEVRERYPAVVVVHTIAGYLENNEGRYAAELRKAGFATLTYDSFAARGTTGIALSRSGPGLWPSGVAD